MAAQLHFIITFKERHWWGAPVRWELTGTGSSKQDNELLIYQADGAFISVNYDTVHHLRARVLAHDH